MIGIHPLSASARIRAFSQRGKTAFLGAILLLASFTRAEAQDHQKLIGTWEFSMGQASILLELRADGRGAMAGESFTWTVKGSTIVVSSEDEKQTYNYALEGGSLLLSGGDLPQQIALTKRGQAQHAESAPGYETAPRNGTQAGGVALELVGKWCFMANVNANNGGSMTNECVTFYENGTYEYYRESSSSGQYGGTASQEADGGTWSLDGNVLRAQSRSLGSVQYTLEKRNHPKNTGDPMLVIDGRAFVTATQRAPW